MHHNEPADINSYINHLLSICSYQCPASDSDCRVRLVCTYVFISWCSPFFHLWPVAMSQWRRSEVSTPRHNSLSGKNNSLMPQSSYVVWDDSESGEAYCLDVFVVQVHCCGMWGFPPLRVFLDLCVNSCELCIMLCSVGSKGGVCATIHMCGNLCVWPQRVSVCVFVCVRVCVCWEPCSVFLCRIISMPCKTRICRQRLERYTQSPVEWDGCSASISSEISWYLPSVSHLTAPDWTTECQLKKGLVWTLLFAEVFQGGFTGSPGGLWPPRVMFSSRSLFLTAVNGGVHAGDSGRMTGVKSGSRQVISKGNCHLCIKPSEISFRVLLTTRHLSWHQVTHWLDPSSINECVSVCVWVWLDTGEILCCTLLILYFKWFSVTSVNWL